MTIEIEWFLLAASTAIWGTGSFAGQENFFEAVGCVAQILPRLVRLINVVGWEVYRLSDWHFRALVSIKERFVVIYTATLIIVHEIWIIWLNPDSTSIDALNFEYAVIIGVNKVRRFFRV